MSIFNRTINFNEDIKTYVNYIEKSLKNELNRHKDSFFYEPIHYALRGGKRIRPLILLLSADCVVNGKGLDPYPAALIIELSHTESLIHDDLIDDEISRRGRKPVYIKFGRAAAILSADYILAIILDIVRRHGNSYVTDDFISAIFRICEGEIGGINTVKNPRKLDYKTYLNIIENKTAALFSASAKIGAMIGDGNEEEVKALSEYGRFFGLSYQIKDDILDFREVRDNINTSELPIKFDDNITLEHLEKKVKIYSEKAIKCLKRLRETKAKKYLIELAKFEVMSNF